MATENINTAPSDKIYNTQIPTLGSDADIQKALIAYHYGDENFDRSETDTDNLIPESMAYYLNSLQEQIDSVSGVADIPQSIFNASGDILGASADNVPAIISLVATDGYVLTVDSTYTSSGKVPGITWKPVSVTQTNSVVLYNKSISNPKIVNSDNTGTGYILDYAGSRILDFTSNASSVNYVNIANSATTPTISSAGSGTNVDLALSGKGTGKVTIGGSEVVTLSGSQILTNKTISSITTNSQTLNFPAITGTDTLVSVNLAQTLANKTLVSATTFLSGDAGKTAQFAINSSQASTGVFTLPATNGTLALNNQTFFLGTTSIAINRTSTAQSLTGITSIDGRAASITGGDQRQFLYQSAANTTAFAEAPTATGQYLQWNGTKFTWTVPSASGTGDITGVGVSGPITGGGYSGDVTIGLSTTANFSTSGTWTFGGINVGNVSNTEIGYLDGLTSNIKTQLDNKLGGVGIVKYGTATDLNSSTTSSTHTGSVNFGYTFTTAPKVFANISYAGDPSYSPAEYNINVTPTTTGFTYYILHVAGASKNSGDGFSIDWMAVSTS